MDHNSESILLITPVDGYVYTDEEGTAFTKTTLKDGSAAYAFTNALDQEQHTSLELFTVRLQSYDAVVEHIRSLEGEPVRLTDIQT